MIPTRIARMMALVVLALGGCTSYPPALSAAEYIVTAERSPEGAYNPISVSINLPLAVRTFVVTGDSPSRRHEERRV